MPNYVDFETLNPGDALPPLVKPPLSKVQFVRYAGASGDFNPIHTDDETARQSGLPGVIAQGMLVMGFVGQAVGSWAPARALKRINVRFVGMSYPGEVLTVDAVVAEKMKEKIGLRVVCDMTVKDAQGSAKLSGRFELLLER